MVLVKDFKEEFRLALGAMAVDVIDDYKKYRTLCLSKVEKMLLLNEVTETNSELIKDLILELKAHENEIRKIRQKNETQIQRYKMQAYTTARAA